VKWRKLWGEGAFPYKVLNDFRDGLLGSDPEILARPNTRS